MSTLTRPTGRARRLAVTSVVLALGLGLTACADNGSEADATAANGGVRSINKAGLEPSRTTPTEATDGTGAGGAAGTTGEAVVDERLGERRDPTPNQVDVDGGFGSLTTPARRDFADERAGITVTQDSSGDTRAFERLCIGDIDIADSSRPITVEEYEQCRRNGLDVVQFQVAADAVVLAIRSQTDVGTDCLSTDQVRAGFRNGSTITNWSELGPDLDDVEFEAGGPTVEENAGRFFGRYVLQSAEPVNADFRVDYVPADEEDQTRRFVTGSDEDRLKARDLTYIGPTWKQYTKELKTAWGYWADANEEVQAAVAEQRKGIRDKRTPAARAKDDARVTRAYAERGRLITAVNAAKAKLRPIDVVYRDLTQRQRRINDELGHVGLFSHGYYATYEDRLRPFEIEVSDDDDQPNCIFPSPQTILNGEYPLSQQLLLTVTTRSLQRPEVRAFLTSYLENSQSYADEAGVVAIPGIDRRRQLAWLEDEANLPRFGVVDGEFREIDEEEERTTEAAPPPAPVQNPAR
ncbi:MAG: hypothetical protein JWN84_3475 [Nocardioides sp.]|nr:hypothetical protein [Nocardioides sp.]